MPTVLVIDDNPSVATALEVLFSLQDIDTLRALTPEAGLQALQAHDVDLVVQDMNFSADTTSGEEGVALFREIRGRHPDLPVILLTAWTHLDAAVDLIKAGAADYLAKPWDDRKLDTTVENLIELGQANRELQRRLQREQRQRRELEAKYDLRGIVGMATLWVNQRRKQIGVRRALGARKLDILRYFITENFIITSGGVVAGLLLAVGLNQLLVSQLELTKLPIVYLAVGSAVLWLVGVAAVYAPAWRASGISPAIATRSA